MKFVLTLVCFIASPLLIVGQVISISSGIYNQSSITVQPMIEQSKHNEMDSFAHLDVDNILSYKGFEFGASYSFMRTGISIFVKDSDFGIAGEGTVNVTSNRIGLKFLYPLEFLKRFRFSPYILASYELSSDLSFGNTSTTYGKFNPDVFSNVDVSTRTYDVEQFVPSLGAQLNIRVYRAVNLVFNLQYSFATKIASDLTVNYLHNGYFNEAHIQNTNQGSMMSFGLAWDLDYKRAKKYE